MLAHLEPKIHELRLLATFRLIRPGMQGSSLFIAYHA